MYERQSSNFGEFGWLVEVIAGAVEGASLGAAWAVKNDAVRKESSKITRASREKYKALEAAKAQELAAKAKALDVQSRADVLKGTNTKKLVLLGGVIAIALTILGIGIVYTTNE